MRVVRTIGNLPHLSCSHSPVHPDRAISSFILTPKGRQGYTRFFPLASFPQRPHRTSLFLRRQALVVSSRPSTMDKERPHEPKRSQRWFPSAPQGDTAPPGPSSGSSAPCSSSSSPWLAIS